MSKCYANNSSCSVRQSEYTRVRLESIFFEPGFGDSNASLDNSHNNVQTGDILTFAVSVHKCVKFVECRVDSELVIFPSRQTDKTKNHMMMVAVMQLCELCQQPLTAFRVTAGVTFMYSMFSAFTLKCTQYLFVFQY